MENWTLTWTKLTPLDLDNINTIPNSLAGVYRLSFKSDDGNYYVFYVGKSDDIKQKLLEHQASSETNVCIKNQIDKSHCYFRYAIVENDRVRAAAEKQMFKQYQPSCNENEPEGPDDIEVNLD